MVPEVSDFVVVSCLLIAGEWAADIRCHRHAVPDPVDPNSFPLISYRSPFEKKIQEIKVTCMLVSYHLLESSHTR